MALNSSSEVIGVTPMVAVDAIRGLKEVRG
jgi:hypothetical protein